MTRQHFISTVVSILIIVLILLIEIIFRHTNLSATSESHGEWWKFLCGIITIPAGVFYCRNWMNDLRKAHGKDLWSVNNNYGKNSALGCTAVFIYSLMGSFIMIDWYFHPSLKKINEPSATVQTTDTITQGKNDSPYVWVKVDTLNSKDKIDRK